MLVSPSFYGEQNGSNYRRTLDKFEFARTLLLDFDKGDVHPDDFASMFPTLSFVAFNTYSSTGEQLRWRPWVHVEGVITSADDYKAILACITKIIKENGFPLKQPIPGDPRRAHGIDLAKNTPAALFFLPCQPADPSGAFFKVYDEHPRHPLHVEEWLKEARVSVATARPMFHSAVPPSSMGMVDIDVVQLAWDRWNTRGFLPHAGDDELWQFAKSLRAAGLDEQALEAELEKAAASAHSPNDRRSQVRRILAHFRTKP